MDNSDDENVVTSADLYQSDIRLDPNIEVGDDNGGGDESGNEQVANTLFDDTLNQNEDETETVVIKKKILRPQPKLDIIRLQSARGLDALIPLCRETKFAGPGHERRDLDLALSRLQHWAHRLYPKMTFADFCLRLEKLGGKYAVQTQMKRLRLDLDNVSGDHNEDQLQGDNTESPPNSPRPTQVVSDSPVQDSIGPTLQSLGATQLSSTVANDPEDEDFDSLIEEAMTQREIEQNNSQQSQSVNFVSDRTPSPKRMKISIETPVKIPSPVPVKISTQSEEVKERIRKNKEMAIKKREDKIKAEKLKNLKFIEQAMFH